MKSFEATGVWFLPEEPNNQIAGTLTFSKEDGLLLELTGSFRQSWSFDGRTYSEIRGVVSKSPYGKCVTLFRGFSTRLQLGMPGVSLESIRANHGFAGNAFVESEAMHFHGASVSLSSLGAWLNYSGLRVNYNQDGTEVSWSRPDQFQSQVKGATISTGFGLNTKGGPMSRVVSLEEVPSFSIEDFGTATATEIHSRFVGPLVKLITFASDSPTQIEDYGLFTTNSDSTSPAQFHRLYSAVGTPHEPSRKRGSELLFTLADVPHGFMAFLPAWFRFVEEHPDFSSMFFSYGYEQSGYLENRFLFRMLAAECLVREGDYDGAVIKSFEALRASCLNTALLSSQPHAHLAFPSAIQLATPTLFSEFIGRHWQLVSELVGTTESRFTEACFATLNYVTNRGTPGKEAVKNAGLYWLLERLAAAIKICVLRRVGFDDPKILGIISSNSQLAHLKTIRTPWDAQDEAD